MLTLHVRSCSRNVLVVLAGSKAPSYDDCGSVPAAGQLHAAWLGDLLPPSSSKAPLVGTTGQQVDSQRIHPLGRTTCSTSSVVLALVTYRGFGVGASFWSGLAAGPLAPSWGVHSYVREFASELGLFPGQVQYARRALGEAIDPCIPLVLDCRSGGL